MNNRTVQGGTAIEILNPTVKSSRYRACVRLYDKSSNSYIFSLENPMSKINITNLSILQPFLVLQIFIPAVNSCTIEIGIKDNSGTTRRIMFNTNFREITITHLNTRMPGQIFKRNVWLNLCLDLKSFLQSCYPQSQFRMLDSLQVSAFCKIRRVFSMKFPLWDPEVPRFGAESVPRHLEFPRNCSNVPQFIDQSSFKQIEEKPGDNFLLPPLKNKQQYEPSWMSAPGLQTKPFKSSALALDNRRKQTSETPSINSPQIRLKPLNIERFNPKLDYQNKKNLIIKRKKIQKKRLLPEATQNLERYSNYSSVHQVDSDINEEIEMEQPSPNINSDQLTQMLSQPEDFKHPESKSSSQATKRQGYYEESISKLSNLRPFTPPFEENYASKQNILPKDKTLQYDQELKCYFDAATNNYYEAEVLNFYNPV